MLIFPKNRFNGYLKEYVVKILFHALINTREKILKKNIKILLFTIIVVAISNTRAEDQSEFQNKATLLDFTMGSKLEVEECSEALYKFTAYEEDTPQFKKEVDKLTKPCFLDRMGNRIAYVDVIYPTHDIPSIMGMNRLTILLKNKEYIREILIRTKEAEYNKNLSTLESKYGKPDYVFFSEDNGHRAEWVLLRTDPKKIDYNLVLRINEKGEFPEAGYIFLFWISNSIEY